MKPFARTHGPSSPRRASGPRRGSLLALRSPRNILRLLNTVVLAAASSLGGVAPAQAGVPHASQLSPFVDIMGYTWGDCFIKVGPAYDNWHAAPDYHFFGAGEVNCASSHEIDITILQYRDSNGSGPGGDVGAVGDPGSSGPLYTNYVWVATGPACKDGSPDAEFFASAYLTIDGNDIGWLPGYQQPTPQGCP